MANGKFEFVQHGIECDNVVQTNCIFASYCRWTCAPQKRKYVVLMKSPHSGWYEPNGIFLTINQFLGSFSVPESRYTNSPFFWIQSVKDVVFLR